MDCFDCVLTVCKYVSFIRMDSFGYEIRGRILYLAAIIFCKLFQSFLIVKSSVVEIGVPIAVFDFNFSIDELIIFSRL